jgi:long-subunit fatty acid transport protein
LALGWAIAAERAEAGETHYQSFHVGEWAAGMAGAFTALGDEATGAYYNPAGMVDVPRMALALTVSAYQLDLRRLDDQFSVGERQGRSQEPSSSEWTSARRQAPALSRARGHAPLVVTIHARYSAKPASPHGCRQTWR